MLHVSAIASPVGVLTLAATDHALTHLGWRDVPGLAHTRGHPILIETERQLAAYFAGTRRGFDLPLAPAGTPFQQAVWQALLAIPHGETRSYLDVARMLGQPTATRAVGAANGRNPIAIVMPCHRVIGANGGLTGFGGGLANKRWLLDHERRDLFST
jgi:methylated-DNA-[protein]-cysteine S-methyltransferase